MFPLNFLLKFFVILVFIFGPSCWHMEFLGQGQIRAALATYTIAVVTQDP